MSLCNAGVEIYLHIFSCYDFNRINPSVHMTSELHNFASTQQSPCDASLTWKTDEI